MGQEERQLASYPFGGKGAVEVVRRNTNGKVYVDLRLRVGRRYVALPRRSEEELIAALRAGFGEARTAYSALIAELNTGD